MTLEDLRQASMNRNVWAFLRVIRAGEGTSDEDGYRRMFGGDLFNSFKDHPRVLHTQPTHNGSLSSTAAGAYQFLSRTWDALVKEYGFKDFSPENQDLGAVALIAQQGALDDVMDGNFSEAVKKCNPIWASLPGSPYGQPTRTLVQALDVYAENGGKIQTA